MVDNMNIAAAPPRVAPTRGTQARVYFASYLGTVIEWYDFYIYGVAATLIFAKIFFPGLPPWMGVIASFGTFATGYLIRPVGAILWGHFGDRIGRKRVMIITALGMGIGTMLVGLMPTTAQIGWVAPLLLVMLRAFQGLAAAGEWGGASVMTVEFAKPEQRGLWGSTSQFGSISGTLAATGIYTAVQSMPQGAFLSWGWRIPFVAAIVLVALALWMRLRIMESPVFAEAKQGHKLEQRAPIWELLKTGKRGLGKALLITIGPFTASSIFLTFSVTYAKNVGFTTDDVLRASIICQAVALPEIFFFGWLSDKIGRRLQAIAGSVLLITSSLAVFPLINTGTLTGLYVAWLFMYFAWSSLFSIAPALYSELFSTGVRFTGVSLGWQLAGAVGGGLTPLIATSVLVADGGPPHTTWIGIYVGFTALLSLAGAIWLPRRRKAADLRADPETLQAGGPSATS
jgi:MFS family permease